MISLKNEFTRQGRNFSKLILIPLMLFIVILSVALWVTVFYAKANEINADAEIFVKEVNGALYEVEYEYNFLLSQWLRNHYKDGFGDESINELKTFILDNPLSSFQVEAVNYYRLTENFYIYETDFPPDLGRDFGDSDYFLSRLSNLKKGEIFLDNVNTESATGDMRLYGYIKMPDNSYFELGIKFHGITETIQGIATSIFSKNQAKVILNREYSNREWEYLNDSLESDKAIFSHVSFVTADYYISKLSNHGIYNFVVRIHFIYPLLLLLSAAVIVIMLVLFRRIINRKINKISRSFSTSIETVERNVTNFHLTEIESEPEPVKTNIKEIYAISNAFEKMRNEILGSYQELNAMNEELEASYLENQTLLDKVETLLNVPDYLLYLDHIEKFLVRSFEHALMLINEVDYAHVAVIEGDVYKFLDARGNDVEKLNSLKLPGDKYQIPESVKLFDYEEKESPTSPNNLPELSGVLKNIAQMLVVPICTEHKYYGSMTFLTQKHHTRRLNRDDRRIASYFTNYLNGYLMIHELSVLEEDLQKETIYSLIKLLEQHDPYTKGHSESVAQLASKFVRFLNLPEQTAQDLYWAGIVHDMGKILIPHNILNKPSRLTKDEFEIIKKHPVYAWDVLKNNSHMEHIALYIKHHHEKYDGTGYPDGLKGDAIPFESRLLTLADSWDAMRAKRIYKDEVSEEKGIEDFRKNAGIQFDPELVENWIKFVRSDMY